MVQDDIREVDVGEAAFDVMVAAAVFHHLRTDGEWQAVGFSAIEVLHWHGCFAAFGGVRAPGH